jgi:excisionase family DNA binding protein
MNNISDHSPRSPWMTATDAASYLKRGRRFVLREIKSGRLRGAVVGGRREVLTRAEWCDEWVADHTAPVSISSRRRA